jgi:hypothetical protein
MNFSSSSYSDKYPIEEIQMKIYDIISESPVQEAGILLKTAAQLAKSKLASSSALKGVTARAKNFGSSYTTPINILAKTTGTIGFWLKIFGLGQMINDYNVAVKKATADHKAGKLSPEQYQENLKQQKSILVAQLAIALPGYLALKISSNWSFWVIGLKALPSPFTKAIGALMAGLAVSVQAGLIQALRTDKFANLYAEFIAGSSIGNVSEEIFNQVRDLIKSVEKKVTGKSSDTPDEKPDATSATDKAATSTSPGVDSAAPSTAAEPPQQRPGVYIPDPKFDAYFKSFK